ncbi:MAG: PASTA domain-containing protein [Gemmatimonadota bacterium]
MIGEWWRSRERKPLLVGIGVVLAAAFAGYLATCAIYPAQILADNVVVPALRGLDSTAAIAKLAELGLRGRVADDITDPLVAPGQVSWQSPAPETVLPADAVVRLGVSSGRPPIVIPDLVDLPIDLARTVVAAAGLVVGSVDTVTEATEYGTVVRQSPSAGLPGTPQRPVDLTVSRGAASVRVPELVGLTLIAARDRLAAQGLRVGVIDQRFEGKAGSVLAQSPAPGELVTKESGVNLTISGAMP